MLELDVSDAFKEVLVVLHMVGDLPTRGLMTFANSLAVSQVADPLLEIMGLKGTPALCILGSP